MPAGSPLDDPRNATHAWRRFRRMMLLMGGVTTVAIAAAMAIIYSQNGLKSIHLYIATGLGIGFAMLLTGALMSLVFMSSGTGHDESVDDARPPEWDRHD
ncbi:MAG: hypothetical protein ABIT09_06115 [Croceibacterium sp.]